MNYSSINVILNHILVDFKCDLGIWLDYSINIGGMFSNRHIFADIGNQEYNLFKIIGFNNW